MLINLLSVRIWWFSILLGGLAGVVAGAVAEPLTVPAAGIGFVAALYFFATSGVAAYCPHCSKRVKIGARACHHCQRAVG